MTMRKNRLAIYIFYLIVFCGVTISINILFSIIKSREITQSSIFLAALLGIALWIYFIRSGKIK
jgi:hypothetical protein